MTPKQKRFASEYLVDCNATQAAIRAGYSKNGAGQTADHLLKNTEVRKFIDEQLKQIQDKTIADATEVMQYLTKVLRGESSGEVLVVEGCGDGVSEARLIQKAPEEKDKLKAAELLGKRYGLYTDKVDVNGAVEIVIAGEEELED